MRHIESSPQTRDYLDHLIQKKRVPGIQYLVVDAQNIQFEYCGGYRDIQANLAVTPETTFMASSTTKVLTAAAVLQLIERGKVELDRSLSTYYSNHPYGMQVTIRHLLNQTSGIPNPLPLRWLHSLEAHAAFDEDQALQNVMCGHPRLTSIPGDKYAYSNISYWLLGKVIQAASGQSYCEYMRQNVFATLRINQAEMNCVIPDATQKARGYQHRYSLLSILAPLLMDKTLLEATEARWVRLRPVYMNGAAYGGLIGTAHGFSLFLQDQLREKPLLFSPETRKLFFSQQKNNHGKDIETTLGWHTGRVTDIQYYGKPGGGPGFQSNLRVYPARGIASVWFVNATGVSEGAINRFTDTLDRQFLT